MGAEILGRFVRRAGDQQVIAGADERQDRIGHRRCAAGVQHAAGAALQLHHRILQGEVGQGAASAVKQLAVGALRGGVFFGSDGVEDQRRGALRDGIDGALGVAFAAAGADQRGFDMF